MFGQVCWLLNSPSEGTPPAPHFELCRGVCNVGTAFAREPCRPLDRRRPFAVGLVEARSSLHLPYAASGDDIWYASTTTSSSSLSMTSTPLLCSSDGDSSVVSISRSEPSWLSGIRNSQKKTKTQWLRSTMKLKGQ